MRIVRGILIVLLALVLALNVGLLFSRFVLKEEPPHLLGYYPMIVATGSMEPALPAGSVVIARAQADYAVGDVLSFRQGGAVVTHRIIEETADGFRTQGDANSAPDSETVPHGAALGRVILCLPHVGRAAMVLQGPLGILALAAVGAVLFLLPSHREKRRDAESNEKTE